MERREKEVREERSQGCLFSGSVLQGIEETGSKERDGLNKAQRRWHSSRPIISPLSLLNEKVRPFFSLEDAENDPKGHPFLTHGKEKMVLVFIFPLLSLFSLVRFPVK